MINSFRLATSNQQLGISNDQTPELFTNFYFLISQPEVAFCQQLIN